MSWEQEYNVPSVVELLSKLTDKQPVDLLEDELLLTQGIKIEKTEIAILDGGLAMGVKVILSDGRVFVPKLVEKFVDNGNHGVDTYAYVLESETPEVRCAGADFEEIENEGC